MKSIINSPVFGNYNTVMVFKSTVNFKDCCKFTRDQVDEICQMS